MFCWMCEYEESILGRGLGVELLGSIIAWVGVEGKKNLRREHGFL
jgi:hypothetical protein